MIVVLNHSAQDDYNTESIIFKMAALRFLDFSKEINIMKESVAALIITLVIILKHYYLPQV